MAPMSRGKGRLATKRLRSKTESRKLKPGNRHRFESFSQRIAGLKIDPVRRAHQSNSLEEQDSSYFKVALEEWKDRNMSGNFTDFVQETEPLCQTLPQILHHQDDIVSLLLKYLSKEDPLSLEPLLNLTTHFAHDMGTKFEPFFERIVAAVCQIAACHQDIDVIEWSFNCLAWLFKYLSRLLVSDLRPLYDLLSPLLGKTQQKIFVTRFAAEAMSFLVRKAGALFEKNQKPLTILLEHAFADVANVKTPGQMSQHQEGLVLLFAESIKGVNHGVTSSGPAILKAILARLFSISSESNFDLEPIQTIVESVLINTMHHTNPTSFEPLLNSLLDVTEISEASFDAARLEIVASLLLVVAGTRNGNRVTNWHRILGRSLDCIRAVEACASNLKESTVTAVLNTAAVIWTSAPLHVLGPASQTIAHISGGAQWTSHFLAFCALVDDLDSAKFRYLILPYLPTFLEHYWRDQEAQLCFLLPGFSSRELYETSAFSLPIAWQQHILSEFQKLHGWMDNSVGNLPDHVLPMCNRYLDFTSSKLYAAEIQDQILKEAASIAKLAFLNPDLAGNMLLFGFALGKSFGVASEHGLLKDESTVVWQCFSKINPIIYKSSQFLNSLASFIRLSCVKPSASHIDKFLPLVVENLASPSHILRLRTLQVIDELIKYERGHSPEILKIALSIEGSTFDFENSRSLAMNVRKLALKYESSSVDPWIKSVIPSYCFGLLYVRFTPLWEEVCNALKTMSSIEGSEDIVLRKALAWIQLRSNQKVETSLSSEEEESFQIKASEFECSRVLSIRNLAQKASNNINSATAWLKETLNLDVAAHPLQSPASRAQGLRVLNTIPQLAEKRSRSLVPIILNWNQDDIGVSGNHQDENGQNASDSRNREAEANYGWSRTDQKELLGIFAQFSNPTVLYRSNEVRHALLVLLTNGDAEIQKMALKALFAWKSPSIRPYQQNLVNILDDARFRDEITVFVDVDQETGGIRQEDRNELMPVLLRLLYGRLIARTGSSSSHGGHDSKRKAVLAAMSRFGPSDIGEFISIALGPLDKREVIVDGHLNHELLRQDLIPSRKQLGTLKMIQDIFASMSNLLHPFSSQLINAVLYCAVTASQKLSESTQPADEAHSLNSITLSKAIRQEALACINLLFTTFQDTDWMPYVPLIMDFVISPRLPNLASENIQSVSMLLKLLSTLSESIGTVQILLNEDPLLLENLSLCLAHPMAKDEVTLFIMNSIIGNITSHATDQKLSDADTQTVREGIQLSLREKTASTFLASISTVLRQSQSQEVIEACVSTILSLAQFICGLTETKALLESATYLLTQPTKRISPRLKGEVLKVIENLISYSAIEDSNDHLDSIFEVTASLFAFFKDNPNRRRLVQILHECAKIDTNLHMVAGLCDQLNSFSSSSLDLPDFEQRQNAFRFINEENTSSLNLRDWRPIVYNMLFFIRDNEEYVIRTSASLSLRRFIKSASQDTLESSQLREFALDIVIPALQKGMGEPSELVRSEYVSVLAEFVNNKWDTFRDMETLAGPDEESSFFNNILHIQAHRRIRALRRLGTDAKNISSVNVSRVLLPLVEVFLSEAEEEAGNLISEATTTVGVLAEHLEWPKFRSLLQKRIAEASKFDSKLKVKALGAVVDALARAHSTKIRNTNETESLSALSASIPNQAQLTSNLSRTILPNLTEYVHFPDDSSVNLRVLVAPIIIKLIMMLPLEEVSERLPPLLMDICSILKSRAQDTRDTARKTLAEISAIIGPTYFGFVLKQLRDTLQRGSHLHVLSYTVHSLLVAISPSFQLGAIDNCLDDLMAIIIGDIFGTTGQEKDAQDYVSKMREVRKKNLSYDSLELIATFTSLPQVSTVIKPLKNQLEMPKVKLDKIDEMLRRLREGLRRNPAANERQFLILCFEILTDAFEAHNNEQRLRSNHSYKFVSFAFELLRRVLDKHEHLKTPENLAGFLPMLELSLNQGNEEIQISGFRFLSSIVKIPLDDIDEKASVYIRQAMRVIEDATSTNTPLAQTALRLIASILRERPNASLEQDQFEMDIAYLLTKIRPDLPEPARHGERDRQVAAFNLLKAILSRGVLLKEIYDVMETVREVMITNSEHPIPDLARSVYSRFLHDYFPDESKGLARQVDFLVSNLRYPHARGRVSVMEVIHFMFSKKDVDSVQPLLTAFFLPLLLVLVTDESTECRESANLLIHKLFERANKDQTKLFTTQLRKWLDPDQDALWQRVALQCWKSYFDVHSSNSKEARLIFGLASNIIEATDAEHPENEKLVFDAIELCQKFSNLFPNLTFSFHTKAIWITITSRLNDVAADVVLSSAKLLSMLLSHLANNKKSESGPGQPQKLTLPIHGPFGYELDRQQALHIVESSFSALEEAASEEITSLLVRNIAFIGRCCQISEKDHQVLRKILTDCAALVRRETDENGLQAQEAALQLLTALCKLAPLEAIQPSLDDILMPLQNLTDTAIPRRSFADASATAKQDQIVAFSHELLTHLQTKFGTADFVNQMQQVQKEVRERREERRAKRRLDVVSAPEKAGREKQRRHLVKREKRREKNSRAAGMRRGW